SSLVAIGNIHGQGELLLEHLAELPPDDSDEPAGAAPATPERTPQYVEATPLYAPHLDPYQQYPPAYEDRYAPHHGAQSAGEQHPHPEPPAAPYSQQNPAHPARLEQARTRGLFEPRVPPADDSPQWHNPGEQHR
ncbi:poly-gamma-glutamate synthase PgsB, partial [Streptomyces violascens]